MTQTSKSDKKMASIKWRVSQLYKYVGVSKKVFFESIDASSSAYRGDLDGKGVNSDVIVKIMTLYPAVNIRWVLLNEGSPIQTGDAIRTDVKISGSVSGIGVAVSNSGNNNCREAGCRATSNNNADKEESNLILGELLRSKDAQITRLTETLAVAQDTIRNLSYIISGQKHHNTL